MIDFESDKESASPSDLKKISEKAKRAIVLRGEIAAMEARAQKYADELKIIEQEEIPELMKEAGMASYTLEDGSSVSIKQVYIGSIPSSGAIKKATGEERDRLEERKAACLKFIEDNNGSSIIKSLAEVDIGKDPELKEKVEKALEEIGASYFFDDTVHYQTLQSWLKEKVKNNVDIPTETFQIFSGEIANIKIAK